MERKIGEIFEYNGEWCQCVESKQGACTDCAFNPINGIGYNCSGSCTYKQVIFKKLEKVGEPFYRRWTLEGNNKLMQRYKIYTTPLITIDKQRMFYNLTDNLLEIEIKQTKEDMEEKNLKPFDLEAAKAGKPVVTMDGRKARVICFDRNSNKPIVALITTNDREYLTEYYCDGRISHNSSESNDLMMLPEKKEGWINLPKDTVYFDKKEIAEKNCLQNYFTVKIEWEE